MEPVHMVDADSNFRKENVDSIINCWAKLRAPNAPYSVVSIIGAQSSGKSTLMNRLFDTKFPMMNAKVERCQTSRGIMMSSCTHPSLILLDVEGFDGTEKGQDTLFENQAAFFALAVSDLMMVNISMHDIGRQHGGGTDLFRIVFQEIKKLQQARLTKILVVIRFYDGQTPLHILEKNILGSMQKIWVTVNKEYGKSTFNEHIEVKIFGLPDMMTSSEFPKEVTRLKELLSSNKNAKVPATSFSESSRILWDAVKNNKDLHIPSHWVKIFRKYCRTQAENILNSLSSHKDYNYLKDKESPILFQEISDELVKKLLTEYDVKTNMYDRDVSSIERAYLEERLRKALHDLQVKIFRKYCRTQAENILNSLSSHKDYNYLKDKESPILFQEISDELVKKLLTEYDVNTNMCDRDVSSIERAYLEERLRKALHDLAKRQYEKARNRKILGGAIMICVFTIKLTIFGFTGIPPLY